MSRLVLVLSLWCSTAMAQTVVSGIVSSDFSIPLESGLIRAERMTDQEAAELKTAQDALTNVKNKIASQHNMESTGGSWGFYIQGEMCTANYEIKDKFLLYYRNCSPLSVLTGTPAWYTYQLDATPR